MSNYSLKAMNSLLPIRAGEKRKTPESVRGSQERDGKRYINVSEKDAVASRQRGDTITSAMTDTNQLLHKIGTLIDQKLEPIKKDMATKADIEPLKTSSMFKVLAIARLEQGQAQTNTTLGQITTAIETLAAGQKEQATKTIFTN